jgi:hypothetical protein
MQFYPPSFSAVIDKTVAIEPLPCDLSIRVANAQQLGTISLAEMGRFRPSTRMKRMAGFGAPSSRLNLGIKTSFHLCASANGIKQALFI